MLPTRPTLYGLPLIGWKEHVLFPKLKLGPLVAKIDTGARTAALHADEIQVAGKRVKSPSYLVKAGAVIRVSPSWYGKRSTASVVAT